MSRSTVRRDVFETRRLRLREGDGRDPLWFVECGGRRIEIGRHAPLARRRRVLHALRQAIAAGR